MTSAAPRRAYAAFIALLAGFLCATSAVQSTYAAEAIAYRIVRPYDGRTVADWNLNKPCQIRWNEPKYSPAHSSPYAPAHAFAGGLKASPKHGGILIRFAEAPAFEDLLSALAEAFQGEDAPALMDLAPDGNFAVVWTHDPAPRLLVQKLLLMRGVLWLEPDCGEYSGVALPRDPAKLCASLVRRDPIKPMSRKDLEQQAVLNEIQAPVSLERRSGGMNQTVVAVMEENLEWRDDYLAAHLLWNAAEASASADPNSDDDHNGYCNDLVGWDFIDRDGDPAEWSVDPRAAAHATKVAGVVAAMARRADLDIRILPLRTFARGMSSARISRAIRYAVNRQARVLITTANWPQDSLVVREALQAGRDAGLLIVTSPPNQKTNVLKSQEAPPIYQVLYDNVIAVQPLMRAGVKCNFGFIPGVSLLAAPSPVVSIIDHLGGSSGAAAVVGGAAAIIYDREVTKTDASSSLRVQRWLAAHANPNATDCHAGSRQKLINLKAIR